MNSRLSQIGLIVVSQLALVSCNTYNDAAPGMSRSERRVLIAKYYWKPEQKPFTYTSEQLDALLRRSTDPSLDGATAEAQMSALIWALATVGDDTFSSALARQSEDVKRAVNHYISYIWKRNGLRYPKTERVLQPYT